jgi:hypothetical protein
VIKVAEKLIKTVHGRQMLIAIAEVVFAKLAGAIALGLEQLSDGGIFRFKASFGARQPHLAETGAEDALTGDESRTTSGAALFGVVVDEATTLLGYAVNVGGLIAHQAIAVATQVALTDIVTPEDENVGFSVWHGKQEDEYACLKDGLPAAHRWKAMHFFTPKHSDENLFAQMQILAQKQRINARSESARLIAIQHISGLKTALPSQKWNR